MQDLTPVVADDEKAVQNTKSERWNGEKVHRSNGLAMVSEERQPSLHRIWISRGSPDPSRDTPFRAIETELEQFAVNARCSPGRILGNHTEDQGANLFADTLPSSHSSEFGDPCPIQAKPRSMPVHRGSRSDQDDRPGPPGPERSQRNPEQLVQGSQSMARSLRVQSQQLPTKSQVFEDEVLARTASAEHQPRKCRSDTIIARILSDLSEFSSSPSHSFCRCTTFWRGTALRVNTKPQAADFREALTYTFEEVKPDSAAA